MAKEAQWKLERDSEGDRAQVTLDTGEVLTLFVDSIGLHVMLDSPRLAVVESFYGNGLCIFPFKTGG